MVQSYFENIFALQFEDLCDHVTLQKLLSLKKVESSVLF